MSVGVAEHQHVSLGRAAFSRLVQRWVLAVALAAAATMAGAMAHPAAAQDRPAPDVSDIRVSTTPNRARLIVDLTSSTNFAIAALDNPNRLVIDIAAARITDNRPSAVAGAASCRATRSPWTHPAAPAPR